MTNMTNNTAFTTAAIIHGYCDGIAPDEVGEKIGPVLDSLGLGWKLVRTWLEEMELGYEKFYGKELTSMEIRLDKFPDTKELRKRLMEVAEWNAIFIGPRDELPYMKKVITYYMKTFPEASDEDVITADRCFCRMDLVEYENPSPINHTVIKIRDHMKNAMMANDTALDDFIKMIGSSDEEFFDYLLNIGEAYP